MPDHLPSLVVELCPLGAEIDPVLEAAADAANHVQTEFFFELTPADERARCQAYREVEYRSEKVCEWLIEYRMARHTPQRAFIGFVDQPLRSTRLAGLFSSHFPDKQIAVVTLDNVAHFGVAPADYVLYYLIRYTFSFLAPDLKVHASRNCYFDDKMLKRRILDSMDSGRLCDDCDAFLQQRLSQSQHRSVRKLAAVLHKRRTEANDAATIGFSWVHLSDIHFGDGPEHWKIDKEHMVADIVRDLKECSPKPDRVFVTGDIAFSAKPKQYGQAFKWLEQVAAALSLPLDAVRLIPGNHDVNRAVAAKPVVQPLHLEARRVPEKLDQFVADATARRTLRKKLEAYSKFVAQFPSHPPALSHGLDWVEELAPTDIRGAIRILGLASTWVSDAIDGKEHEKGKVFVPNLLLCESQFRSLVSAASGDLVFVLTHHPPEWLHRSSQRLLSHRLARTTSIHICGHVHESKAGNYQAFGADYASYHAVAGASHGEHDEITDHSYFWGAIRWAPRVGRWEFGLSKRVYAKTGKFRPDTVNYSTDSDGFEWREIALAWPAPRTAHSASPTRKPGMRPQDSHVGVQPRQTRIAVKPAYAPDNEIQRKGSTKMSGDLPQTPKAFLSYAWESDELKAWVKEIASTLRSDGVETILDQWHAVPGDQLPAFMERSVRENDFVLIICTPQYKKKSEERIGGVGYEGDVMTAEIYGKNNHRKFIHILREGDWKTSVPSWLTGKYGIDLRGSPFKPERYQDLLTTLLGKREVPPAVRPAMKKQDTARESKPGNSEQDPDPEPITVRVLGVIADEVTEPPMDGTRGSALYAVPFRLSRTPSSSWATAFQNTWASPPEFTLMHRPKIARVSGDRIVLDGTTIEEIESTHRKTLSLCVAKANEVEVELWRARVKKEGEERARREQHTRKVAEAAARLSFDVSPVPQEVSNGAKEKSVTVERISAVVGGECAIKHTEDCRTRRGVTSLWPIRGPGWQHNVCSPCVDAKVREGEWSVIGEDKADRAVHEELRLYLTELRAQRTAETRQAVAAKYRGKRWGYRTSGTGGGIVRDGFWVFSLPDRELRPTAACPASDPRAEGDWEYGPPESPQEMRLIAEVELFRKGPPS